MKRLRILVVDDETYIRTAIERTLESLQFIMADIGETVAFDFEEAGSAEEARDHIADTSPPDIMLLDLKLPGISGIELLEEIGPSLSTTLVIMITAYASIETAVRATKSGAYDFLAKPFTPEELEHVLQKAAHHIVIAHRARALAEEQRQVRFQFLSVLAHELKAPLNAIEGFLNTIIDHTAGNDPAVYEEMLRRCRTRAQFMRKLIIDLLDLTRIESGKKKRELTEVNMAAIARISKDTMQPDADARNITIDIQCDPELSIHGDPGEIEMVFNNLISNAVKYNRENGRVDVRCDRLADTITIIVADTGIGMTEEEAAQLFESFVRIKNEKTFGILGSGLGLAVVKKVAMLYSGDVSVASVPDEGSTFTVFLRDNEVDSAAGKP
ncbi:MAG TPA: HAMP domain-containing sensor histidine kinase [Candidatus Hydrogenedentes bacterium]|jgi:signal transduction histidine kinase|nr:HAMP domain-containing histidine kinase [Candidatus Hydrogenedentota bacterium]HOC67275.1 HAMP domain-containing sensor histidine kinase [Candidatus Hydrogenedentota bacterium]HOH28228.1 HAMP domain-containing sensor histidine kinase [Candidatus Hydrogenedentota bacterium]